MASFRSAGRRLSLIPLPLQCKGCQKNSGIGRISYESPVYKRFLDHADLLESLDTAKGLCCIVICEMASLLEFYKGERDGCKSRIDWRHNQLLGDRKSTRLNSSH